MATMIVSQGCAVRIAGLVVRVDLLHRPPPDAHELHGVRIRDRELGVGALGHGTLPWGTGIDD